MSVGEGGRGRLAERIAALPELLREALAAKPPELGFRAKRGARVVTTGLGSSAAHARFLAQVLDDGGIAARFAPLGALREPPRDPRAGDVRAGDVLVVFSQGLSPNARLAFGALDRFSHAVLVTASAPDDPVAIPQEKRDLVGVLEQRGVAIVPFAGAEEYGSLLRVTGPMLGLASALRIAASLGHADTLRALDSIADRVVRAVAEAPERLRRECAGLDAAAFDGPLSFLATGGYAECVWNLRFKVLEGMLRPLPPVWDPIEVAHGAFQQACAEPTTFLALGRPDAWSEAELLDRLARILPTKSRLYRLHAELPGALATFEHEAMLNALVMRFLEERSIDPDDWPGRGKDGPIYEVGRSEPRIPALRASGHALEALAWPDVERLFAGAVDTAVLPLGSIEQHGPHLPFATDAWIAESLAERFCARFPEAIRLPVLPFGCAREHLAFPGTLSLEEETLAAVLDDLTGSLATHGVSRLLLLSAHGGNDVALAAILPKLREKHGEKREIEVIVAPGPGVLLPLLQAEGERHGVAASAGGLHAGEIEASILLALAPESVRAERFAAGVVDPALAPGDLFYPSLRANAADGTVGDPRGAEAARAERYLEVWVDAIGEAYLREKKRKYAKGTQKA